MPQKMQTRIYPMADADLKQLADQLKTSIVRDATDFATRNIAAAQLTAYQTTINVFDATTTDEELLGLVTDAVEKRDAIVENSQKAIRTIRNMAEITYNSKGKYATFGFDDLSKLTPNDLYRLATRVVRVGNQLLAELSAQGLTAAQLTALGTLATQLDNAIDFVAEKIEIRDLETQDRVIKGNLLWAEMSRLASIGKSLFEDTNEAKYNDYVLVGSSTPPTPPVG